MSESQDIRSILTSKSRAKVNPRDTSLRSMQQKEQSEPLETEEFVDSQSSPDSELQQLQNELDTLPEIGKRLAIHLEKGVRGDLLRLCDEAEITPETFIEAAVAMLQNNPGLKEKVLEDAITRLQKRKRAGVIRRTIAMVQKYI
ncbi:hypothetical protein [Lyngbya sp. PCC 8106]|uniref:hypothetical protein n=1 Tax=Lyngbya sp. (strain PCC 8106) TaxID=313612 RepID=UPI0000EA98E7|nr:hypothetical protein [Lyngbya sp. PCC 8106]EAW35155.1 hypothetical protein L8106_13610 [Lyngbya sp. PCC 8106]